MASGDKYRQFFRFRAPVGIVHHGARTPWDWMFPGLQNMDWNDEVFDLEVVLIGKTTRAFTYSDLQQMPFDRYETLLRNVRKMIKKDEGDGEL